MRERIHVPGHRDDAPALVAACDVFALPSVKREGLARSLIEAMAYGVAPVVTDCGGSPELVVDGRCGIVVPVRDAAALARAIARLYENPELRKRARNGRSRADREGLQDRAYDRADARAVSRAGRSGGEPTMNSASFVTACAAACAVLVSAGAFAQAGGPGQPWRGAGAQPCFGADGGATQCAPPAASRLAMRAGKLFDSNVGQARRPTRSC